jgi:hypothetical protein
LLVLKKKQTNKLSGNFLKAGAPKYFFPTKRGEIDKKMKTGTIRR